MSNQEAIHKRNKESSILFMQQEHATTLKALHDEIQKLQKKCTDLTFELNMAGLDASDGVPSHITEHMKHQENMIDAQRETQHELEVELEKKDNVLKENELMYKRQKMKHIEELRTKGKELEQLRAELDASSNSNAYYQNELLKIKKAQIREPGTHEDPVPRAPTLPKESRSNPKRAFHIRRTLGDNHNSREDIKLLTNVRQSSGGMRISSAGTGTSSTRSDSPNELARPFLRVDGKEAGAIKQSNPLPPIRTSSGRVVFGKPVDVVQVSVHNVSPPHVRSKKAGVTTMKEVETLAVGQVSHSDPAWKLQRRKESHHSSEYR